MEHEGPSLESLTRRLAETPDDFLAEPRIGTAGRIHVAAVVQDLLTRLGHPVEPARLLPFTGKAPAQDRNRLALILILCWLLADDWFKKARVAEAEALLFLLTQDARDSARQVAARKFVTEPERREELARLALARLGCRPAGESIAQAQDRLTSLNSAERARVVQASRKAEERARSIREALVRKAAEESADKSTRE